MKKAAPYLFFTAVAALILWLSWRGSDTNPGNQPDFKKYDSLSAVIKRIVHQHAVDTLGFRARLRARDSVVAVWRVRYHKQRIKTVIVKVREEIPEVDSAFTACDSLDTAYQMQVAKLRYELEHSIKYSMALKTAYDSRDTVSQEIVKSLLFKNDSLAHKNKRLVKSNRRLWTGNVIQAALHAIRSLD